MFFGPCILSLMAFGLYYAYDWCTVRRPDASVLRWGFPTAGGLVLLATGWTALRCGLAWPLSPGQILWGIGSLLSFLLLIDALFFSLPAGTYEDPAERRRVYDGGLYALCRHPGYLAFELLYFCLAMLLGRESWPCFALLCVLNFVYIVLQDRWTFPHIFSDYEAYRRKVPFLVPNTRSIGRWMALRRGRKDA